MAASSGVLRSLTRVVPPGLGHVVDGTELGWEGTAALVARARELRLGARAKRFDGASLAAVFLAPSLRTRTSLEVAASRLGVHPVVLQPGSDAWALELRDGVVMDGVAAEHVREAAAVLGSYADVVAVRAFAGLVDLEADRADRVLAGFCRHAGKPVLSLESAQFHPLQGLADTATWMNHLGDDLRGVPLTLTWAPHPKALPSAVPHQVLLSAALAGMDIRVANPEGCGLDRRVLARAHGLAGARGGGVRVHTDQAEALAGSRVVVAKAWAGASVYADPAANAASRAAHSSWKVGEGQMAHTASAGFMHCLPVRRGVVVDDAVLDGASSWVLEQAENRLWTAMALLERILEKR
jgi:N-acetylornithine carbamoyltransferase